MLGPVRVAVVAGMTLTTLVVVQSSAVPVVFEPFELRSPVPEPVNVADGFRAPTSRFGPGNRAVELSTRHGEPVTAPAGGVVAFAGPVAGRLVVSIDHPNGLRSSLSGLTALTIVSGEPVETGQPVGAASAALDVSLRAGNTYIEPTGLWSVTDSPADRPPGARLVPVPD